MRGISIIAKGSALIIAIAYCIFGFDYPLLDYSLFGLVLLTVGIPHGAIDHLTSNPHTTKSTLIPFLIQYIFMIVIYTIIWYFIPVLALGLFLLMSAYHFGQTHFLGRMEKNTFRAALLYSARGAFCLLVIIFGSFEDSRAILSQIIDISPVFEYQWIILGGLLLLSIALQLLNHIHFSFNDILELTLLPVLLYLTPLAISFILYFGFWHSIPSMIAEYRYLKQYPCCRSFGAFIKQLLPFTGISLLGISMILWIGLNYFSSEDLVLLFFVLISLISFPHILYMDSFIKKRVNTGQS